MPSTNRASRPARTSAGRARAGSRADTPILVRLLRNGIEESVHRGDIVEADVDGRLIRQLGDPDRVVTLRSTVKPFGVVALIEAGGIEAFDLEPDEQLVADAVRMSLSIPFYFEPCELRNRSTGKTATIVDGGVLSNFAIEIFDRTDGVAPRWPTFGVRLLPDLPAGLGDLVPFYGVPMLPAVRLLEQVVATALVGRDQTHLDRPGVRERTMTVDTRGTAITEFGIRAKERGELIARGEQAARDFLEQWEGRSP